MKHILLYFSVFIVSLSVAQPRVTAPNGGESIPGGSTYNITWASCLACVNMNNSIEYSSDNGSTWHVITPVVPDLNQTISWSVPNIASTQCLIKIINGSSFDVSNAVFTITGPAGLNDTKESAGISVKLYPNPVKTEITIFNQSLTKIESIQVYNVLGAMVKEITQEINFTKTGVVSVFDLPAGIYYVGFNKTNATEKVIVAY